MNDDTRRESSFAQQRVELVKTSDLFGRAAVGQKTQSVFPLDMPRDEAKRRAFRFLKRAMPDENPMCWTVSEEANDGR